MNETRTFAKPGRVTIDELAGMTKRRFDELEDQFDDLEDQMEYRFDSVDKRLNGLSKEIKDLTTEVREGFKSMKSQK